MKGWMRRTALLAVGGILLAALISGCTLTGAEPAPLTPVGEGVQPTQEPTEQTLPTPTEVGPIDVFATQTAQAAAATEEPTDEATQEPGGAIQPTSSGTPATPSGSPTPTQIVPGTPGTPSAGTGTCPATHTVQAGENLFRIALKYGLTTNELASANGITNPASIQVGQVLRIPRCGGTGAGAGTGTGTGTGTSGERTHVVQPGENLYRIALKYGLTWQELAEFNGLSNPNAIYVGQVLRIPPANS